MTDPTHPQDPAADTEPTDPTDPTDPTGDDMHLPLDLDRSLKNGLATAAAGYGPTTPVASAWEEVAAHAGGVVTSIHRANRSRTQLIGGLAAGFLLGVLALAAMNQIGGSNGDGLPVASDGGTSTTVPDDTGASLGGPVEAELLPTAWPFADRLTVAAWEADPNADERFRTQAGVVEAFLTDVFDEEAPSEARIRASDIRGIDAGSAEVDVTLGSADRVTTFIVRDLTLDEQAGPFGIVGATTDNIVIDNPTGVAQVGFAAIIVQGKATGFEGTISTRVIEDGDVDEPGDVGATIHDGFLTAGAYSDLARYDEALDLEQTDSAGAMVILFTTSAEDGSLEELAMVRVVFSPVT